MEDGDRDEIRAILRGEAPFTWDAWTKNIRSSETLTSAGKECLLQTAGHISAYLRDDWLDRFRDAGVPLLNGQWWLNQAPHVYTRILELGFRLELLARVDGMGKVRKMMTNDLGSFRHSMLQFEVASLALRDGWKISLEPSSDAGRADIHVGKGKDTFLIEAKVFAPNQLTAESMVNTRRLSETLAAIEWSSKVSIVGSIGTVSVERVAEWKDLVVRAAKKALSTGHPVNVEGPTAGMLVVHPVEFMEGTHYGIDIELGDEWPRVLREIDRKAEQARSDAEPVWLRFDQSTLFWGLQVPMAPLDRARCLAAMASSLHEATRPHRHVAGIILSTAPASGSPARQEWTSLNERATYLSMTVNPPYFRETLVVPSPHAHGPGLAETWRQWYVGEPSWLEWALQEQGFPKLEEILTGSGSEPYLLARSSANSW